MEPTPAVHEVYLRLYGEIDLSVRARLHDDLEAVIGCEAEHLVIDCHSVTFMDSTGVEALVDARNRLHRQGRSMRVVGMCPAVRRPVEVLGLIGHLGVER
jgi:anti-anti-sigma factor